MARCLGCAAFGIATGVIAVAIGACLIFHFGSDSPLASF